MSDRRENEEETAVCGGPTYKYVSSLGVAMAVGMIVVGVMARVDVYTGDLPVNHDEALLYVALQRWTPAEWLTPLGFEQTAGPLYLGLLHFLAGKSSHAEFSYRLISLIASLLTVPIFYVSARTLRPGWTALIATALLALHSGLIIYTGFFKQYETDAFITALVFGMAALIKRRHFRSATWWIVLLSGCLSLFLSQPAIIMLSCLLLWAIFLPAPVAARRWIVICGLVWLTLATILYIHLYEPVAASPYMRSFWADSYVSLRHIGGWRNALHSLFDDGPGGSVPGLTLALLGAAVIFVRKERSSFILAGLPILSVIVLAIFHFYPVAPRLWMFLSPSVAFVTAIGAEFIGAKVARSLPGYTAPAIAATLALVVGTAVLRMHSRTRLLNSVFPAMRMLRYPNTAEKVRRAVHVLLGSKSCDPIYVAARAVPSWYFYTSLEPSEGTDRYVFLEPVLRRDSPAFGDAEPAALHLPDLAPQLDLRVGCREEVYGLASGTPYRNFLPPEGRVPVPGWEKNEIDRILVFGTSGFVLYLDETQTFEWQALLSELSLRHFRYWTPDPSVNAYQVRKD